VTELKFSSSPRTTWLWALDEVTAERARRLVGGRRGYRARQELPLVIHIDIGVIAYESCKALAEAGLHLRLARVAAPVEPLRRVAI
jgi:hypothetical protein